MQVCALPIIAAQVLCQWYRTSQPMLTHACNFVQGPSVHQGAFLASHEHQLNVWSNLGQHAIRSCQN